MKASMHFGLRILAAITLLAPAFVLADDPNHEIEVIFVGDIMLDELPGQVIERGGDPFAGFAHIFKRADITIGNLECVVATSGTAVKKPYTFRAHPRCISVLKRHFTALSVANNHSGDFGKQALVEQCELFEQAGLPYFGGGRNLSAARKPLIVERKGIRLALLGYNEFKPREFEAGENTPGVAWSVDERVIEDIKAAREQAKADLVIPFMHWGWEYEQANDRQRELARKMIDAGADVVVGAHPHVCQAIEYYRGKLIAYSLGNFVFNGFDEPEALTAWLLRLRLTKQGLQRWETSVVRIDDQGIPHLVPDAKSPRGTAASPTIENYHPPYPKPEAK